MGKVERIKKYLADNRDEVEKIIKTLVSTASETGQEAEVAGKIKEIMQESGYDRVIVDETGNVVGKIGDGPRAILYDAHMDTVPAGDPELWDMDPYSGAIEGDNIYGRGACDDKGCLAAMLMAGKMVKELGLDKDVTLYISASVMEETGEGVALGSFIEEQDIEPDYVVVGEPSGNQLRRGHRGRALLKATFAGKAVHASVHDDSNHAIYKALPFIKAVPDLNKRLPEDPVLGRGDICVTHIDVDTNSLNSTPNKCEVIMDRRTTTVDTRESILEELAALPNAELADIKLVTEVQESYRGLKKEIEEYFPAWILEEDHQYLKGAAEAYQAYFDSEAEVDVWPFSTNGNYPMGKMGIPTIGFGPGDSNECHIPNEKISINEIAEAAGFYAILPGFLT